MSEKKYIIDGKEVVAWITRGGERIPIFDKKDNSGDVNEPTVSDDPEKWRLKSKYDKEEKNPPDKTMVKDGITYEYRKSDNDYILGKIIAKDKDGNVVGDLSFGEDRGLKGSVEVHPNFRRRKIATNMYDWAEKILGRKFIPEDRHTKYAEAFWKNRKK